MRERHIGSGKMRKAAAVAVAGIDDDELDGIDDELDDEDLADLLGVTELVEYHPARVDAVPDPANGTGWLLMKQAAGARQSPARAVARVLKADGEKRFTLALAYPADRVDVSVAQDGARDFASAGANEAAAWSFMKSGARIGLMHEDGTEGAGTCVESHLHRGPDLAMTAVDGTQQVIRDGDWIIGVIWDEQTWQAIKAGRYAGVSMQGSAMRRKPSAKALRALRKQRAEEDVMATLQKAAKAAVKQGTAPVMARLGDLDRRMSRIEKARRPACGKCGKRAKAPDARFCTKCGAKFGAVAKSSGGEGDAARAARVIAKARSADPAVRDPALGYLMGVLAPADVARVISGEPLPARALAKAAGQPPVLAKAGTGGLSDGEELRLAALLSKARSADSGVRLLAVSELLKVVGPEMTARVMSGADIDAGEFRRAYLANGRAAMSAAPGQEPRIPQATHVISAEDFRRAPLMSRQSRPAPGSVWPGGGGQWGSYGPGPGTGTSDSRMGLGNTGTGPSVAIPATAGMGRAPVPGEARPW